MIWWLPLVAALPGFFLWTLVHEGAHALVAILDGKRVVGFKPYPHIDDQDGFVFGYVTYLGTPSSRSAGAPYVLDIVVLIALSVAVWFTSSPWGTSTVLAVLALPAVDTMVGLQAKLRENEKCDLLKVNRYLSVLSFYTLLATFVNVAAFVATRA